MKIHPGITMVLTWAIAGAVFLLLPFQLEAREFSFYGFVILALFIASFVGGAFLASPILPLRTTPPSRMLDFTLLDKGLIVSAIIAISMQGYEILTGTALDLDAAYLERNLRSTGALTGSATGGSLAFQVGFLAYPVGFIGVAREILFRRRIDLVRLGLIGFLPLVLASLAMGGRGPILYAIILAAICWRSRRFLFPDDQAAEIKSRSAKRVATWIGAVLVVLVAMNYFVEVFIARANVAGGVEAMQKVAAMNWGVSFDGPGSAFLRATIGEGNAYLVYVFVWYGVQGIVMANSLFTHYDAGLTYGIYGLDLGSAIARRIDPQFVSERFAALFDLNIYGFLPSAFGSIFVDFWFFGFIAVFVWGYLAGLVYRKSHTSLDARWFLVGPFVTMGIIFSLINTPLGFGNGLMIHIWLVLGVLLVRPFDSRLPSRFAAA